MADKPQKTQLLTDAPPEVQAALDKQKGAPPQGATVMLDAPQAAQSPSQSPAGASGQRQVVVPTMMKERPSGALPPVGRRKKPSAARWILGPLVSIGVAGATAALAHVVMPPKPKVTAPPPKVVGKILLSTDPKGASVTIDGKPFPHFTPTTVEAEVGSTVKIGLKLEGYQDLEEDVAVAEGERPMSFKLEKAAEPPPVAVAAPAKKEERHEHEHEHHAAAKAPKEPVGKGTLSVFVRPWAIVYVDGTRLRQTPVNGYELSSGKHTIELVNDPKAKREKMLITLKPGDSQEIRRDWDK
jgi:hypothetical protein